MAVRRKHYSGFHLFMDCLLVLCTGGLWFIWIAVRALRSVS